MILSLRCRSQHEPLLGLLGCLVLLALQVRQLHTWLVCKTNEFFGLGVVSVSGYFFQGVPHPLCHPYDVWRTVICHQEPDDWVMMDQLDHHIIQWDGWAWLLHNLVLQYESMMIDMTYCQQILNMVGKTSHSFCGIQDSWIIGPVTARERAGHQQHGFVDFSFLLH